MPPASPLRRRSLLLGGLATAAVLAVPACGSSSDDAAGSADTGPWSFTDDRGETVELDATPRRIVGLGDAVAALWDFGIEPVGTFGMLSIKDDAQFEGFDTSGVTEVGVTYGEIDAEKLAALKPDLIVTHVYPEELGGTVEGVLLYGFKDEKQIETLSQIAPIVAIEMGGNGKDVVVRNSELAASLGADLTSRANARKKKDYDAAATALTKAARSGVTVLAVAGYDTEGLYVAQAPADPALDYYTSLGVAYPDVADDEYYWDLLSWENVDTYRSDVVLYSLRAMDAAALQKQPTFAELPAAEAGQVHPWKFEPLSWGKQAAWMTTLAGYLTDSQKVT
ncbi:ABC transporter substrate-binding protein [Solicola sp. PLA-1-18]|uniref:ABC transporter substrate-binding protein n=1 Tax=Solicola sp. PLA-1-18 TaxID=3380532 RepID=UPI003B7BD160